MKQTEAEVGVLKNPKPSIKTEGAKATQGAGMMCRKAQKHNREAPGTCHREV